MLKGLLFCLLLLLAPLVPAFAQIEKTLHPGDSEVYEFDRMTAAAVGSPAVVDIVPLSGHRLLVNAKAVGQTTLFVFDHKGRHRYRLSVLSPLTVPTDFAAIAAQVQAEIGLPGVSARAVQDTIFLEGTVDNAVAFQRAAALAGVYAPKVRNLLIVLPLPSVGPTLAETYAALLTDSLTGTGLKVQVVNDRTVALTGHLTGSITSAAALPDTPLPRPTAKAPAGSAASLSGSPGVSGTLETLLHSLPPELQVVNLIDIGRRPTRQILVRAKIIDIDRNASKRLGVQWGSLTIDQARSGKMFGFQSQPILFGQSGAAGVDRTLIGGALNRISPLAAQLNALVVENKARVLSEPSLLLLDGSAGSILVGGEIPVPVAQSSSGTGTVGTSVTVQYKPYGVRLLVEAALVDDNTVQMTVTPEVSDLNYANAVQISGFVIPALTVRRATSTLQMADGETLVIGGLYSSTASRQIERIPLLSQIPVLGEFFKNTITRKEENELLILIQPEIVGPNTEGVYPPKPGSLENLPIPRPHVGRQEFDQDFPAFQNRRGSSEKPGPPVSLPAPESPAEGKQP